MFASVLPWNARATRSSDVGGLAGRADGVESRVGGGCGCCSRCASCTVAGPEAGADSDAAVSASACTCMVSEGEDARGAVAPNGSLERAGRLAELRLPRFDALRRQSTSSSRQLVHGTPPLTTTSQRTLRSRHETQALGARFLAARVAAVDELSSREPGRCREIWLLRTCTGPGSSGDAIRRVSLPGSCGWVALGITRVLQTSVADKTE